MAIESSRPSYSYPMLERYERHIMSHEMSLGSCFVAIVYMLCHVFSCVFCMFLEGDTSRASCEAWFSRFAKYELSKG